MNQHQNIFALFFTLYSAMAIAISGKTQPFDTPSMFKGYGKSCLRFVYSFIILNFLPISCFFLTYNILGMQNYPLTYWTTLLLFFSSLIGLGFYRIHYGSMLFRYKNENFFYDKRLYSKKTEYLPSSLYEDLRARPKLHQEPYTHIIPGIIWVLSSLLCILVLFIMNK